MSKARRTYTEQDFLCDILTDGEIRFATMDSLYSNVTKLLKMGYLKWFYIDIDEFDVRKQSLRLNFTFPKYPIAVDRHRTRYERIRRLAWSTEYVTRRVVYTTHSIIGEESQSGISLVLHKEDPRFIEFRDLWKAEFERQWGHKWHVKYWYETTRKWTNRRNYAIEIVHPVRRERRAEQKKKATREYYHNVEARRRYAERRWDKGLLYKGMTEAQFNANGGGF